MNREELSTFGIGLGVGLVAGGILGLLFAPKSGSETRAIIREKAVEVGLKASEIGKKAKGLINKNEE